MEQRRDLVVLAAGRDEELAVKGLLSRPEALGLRALTFDSRSHPQHDAGCRRDAVGILRTFVRTHVRAPVIFDREGCGKEALGRELLEKEVEDLLASNGWAGRAAAIVIDPELEAWVWSDSPRVDEILGWGNSEPSLRHWLRSAGLWEDGQPKPRDPKAAYLSALRRARKPRSSRIFETLGREVSTTRCTDPAFAKLRSTLVSWFGGRS